MELVIALIPSASLLGLFFSLMLAEKLWPLRKCTRPFLPRFAINIICALFAYNVAFITVRPVGHFTLEWVWQMQFGLMGWLKLPSIVKLVCSLLLMDLSFYYWHRMNHGIPLLWRFHNMHHTDPDLDVTTSMRFHAVEIAYSAVFRIVQIAMIGISFAHFILYEVLFQGFTFFHHSNIRLPIQFERLLNFIFVTPRMHGIHHSQAYTEVHRNYGVIFSFWDRLHRSIKLNVPQRAVQIGVPAYLDTPDNQIVRLFLMPFRKQRDYWSSQYGSSKPRDKSVYLGNNTLME